MKTVFKSIFFSGKSSQIFWLENSLAKASQIFWLENFFGKSKPNIFTFKIFPQNFSIRFQAGDQLCATFGLSTLSKHKPEQKYEGEYQPISGAYSDGAQQAST